MAAFTKQSMAKLDAFMAARNIDSPSDIDLLTLTEDEAGQAGLSLEEVKHARRLANLAGNATLSMQLSERGLHSSFHIVDQPKRQFVAQHAEALELDGPEAEALYDRAVRLANRAMQMFATVHGGVASRHALALPSATLGVDAVDYFENLPSYQELFGNLDYLGCEACRSIFGPAAYFVDLMRIVDAYITKPNVNTIPAPFTLKQRRPDLWDIALTCAATNDVEPALQIVNNVLMASVKTALQAASDDALLKRMATTLAYPHMLPFNTPLDRVRVLCLQVKVALSEVFATWKVGADAVVQERLGLSPERAAIVKTAATTPAAIAAFYNVPAEGLAGLSSVGLFMQKTGQTIPELQALLIQALTSAEIAANLPMNLFINQGLGNNFLKLNLSSDDTKSTIVNLNNTALDQLNRLTRLAETLGWTVPATDWCLRAVKNGAEPAIDAAGLAGLDRVNRFAQQFELPPVQASILFGPIKTYGGDTVAPDTPSPFDSLFNDIGTVAQSGSYRPSGNPLNSLYKDTPLNWTPGSTAAADTAAITRLVSGLNLSLAAIGTLGLSLFGAEKVKLTVDTLSALYRHGLLSRCFNLPMEQYVLFLQLNGAGRTTVFAGADLDGLCAAWAQMTAAGIDVYTLAYVLQGAPSTYVDPLYAPANVAPWLESLHNLISDPSASGAADAITQQLAVFFNVDPSLAAPSLAMALAAVPLPSGAGSWVEAFLVVDDKGKPRYADYVATVIGRQSRWLVLAQAGALSAPLLANVVAYPAAYGLPNDFAAVSWAMVFDVIAMAGLQKQFGDVRNDLLAYVTLSEKQAPQADQLAKLQEATGWNTGQVAQLLAGVAAGMSNLVRQLQTLQACIAQTEAFGADVTFMNSLQGLSALNADSGWTAYSDMARLCQNKISACLGPQRWSQMSTQVEGKLQVHKRDALLGLELTYLNGLYPDIATANNVYEFLLTDVETGPEAQLSLIKEGLNALQLYLQRCRLRLEPGVDMLDIPPVWWDWMMDYRMWEANRRIFVYPENYLLPTLRRDQTSPFKQLAADLQQSEITSNYVESAYSSYLTSFAGIAALKPVDAYRTTIDDPKRGHVKALYVLARTDTAPYTFYFCRQLEAAPWSEWQKIDLSISSPHVSPVYAFSRLFLFWVEVTALSAPNIQVSGNSGQTNNDVVHQATIKYSFQDHQGNWVQPQTLDGDVVLLFKGQGGDAIPLASDPLFANCWDLDSLPWRRLSVLRLSAANFPQGEVPSDDFERIVVGFGPYVADVGTQHLTPNASAPDNAAAATFVDTLLGRVWDHNRVVQERLSGGLTVQPNWVLNADLDASYLGNKNEFLLIDPSRAAAPLSQYYPNLDDLGGAVQIVTTGAPISTNLLAESGHDINLPTAAAPLASTAFASETISGTTATAIFNALVAAQVLTTTGIIQPAALATLNLNVALSALLANGTVAECQLPDIFTVLLRNLGSPLLFSSVYGPDARVTCVKNQPGWFQLSASGESFLLQPAESVQGAPRYSTVSEGTLLSPPLVNVNSLVLPMVSPAVDAGMAGQILSLLTTYQIVDARGVVNLLYLQSAPLDVVLANLKLSAGQLAALNGVLYNRPVVYPGDFVGGRITSALSQSIYNLLLQYSIIDGAQRLHLELLTSQILAQVLANMLMQGQLLPRDVSTIYRILVESPAPYNLSYWNKESSTGFTNLAGIPFQVMRLTTAAVGPLNRAFFTGGISRLLSLKSQAIPVTPVLPFERLGPSSSIAWPKAIDGAQVDFDGLYGQYFWELFYHGPMLVANSLATNQQYRDAIAWFQYIFDPTAKERFVTPDTFAVESNQAISPTTSSEIFTLLKQNSVSGAPILQPAAEQPHPDQQCRVNPKFLPTTSLSFLPGTLSALQVKMVRNILLNYQLATPACHYWMFRPFRMQTLESLADMLSDKNPAIKAYEDDPFNPFSIARLRIGAFEKATVMQYIDALIDWGDAYFAQGTWESITAATMLYVYAGNLLGPRPQQVGNCDDQPPATFADIQTAYGQKPIPPFLIDLESLLPQTEESGNRAVPIGMHAFNDLGSYFCVPENDVLVSYWDRVEGQLNKIRHSQDINGSFRLLALFEPPLDPLALIKAAGGANNFLPAGSDAQSAAPPYRFPVVLARARQLAANASQFGGLLQSALERKDAEGLEALRNSFEGQLLALSTQIQEDQISRCKNAISALTVSQAGAKAQLNHYTALLQNGLLTSEQTNLDAMAAALVFNVAANILQTASAVAYTIPQVGSPFAMTYGGVQIGSALAAGASVASFGSEISTFIGQRALTMSGYERRNQDWTLAQSNAQHEYDSLTQQIAANNDDLAAAEQQLVVHKKQIAQSQQLAGYLSSKFSNQALYQWMAGRLSGLYYQIYRLAMQAALSAQAAYRYETASNRSFIDFDYWDQSRAGLLAGEGLTLALDMMEGAYADFNTRHLEVERMISLANIDPQALDTLRQTGSCDFAFPETLFDYDYPGQYCRRIKSLSVSIPAVVGPYQNIRAMLTQKESYVAVTSDLSSVKWLITRSGNQPTGVWADPSANNKQIALSRAIDDSGVFVLNFEDERYLPFEGTGAVSKWTLTLPKETNRIDFEQLSDVVVTLRYTALYDGALADRVKSELARYPLSVGYYVALAQSFSTPWQAFMQDHDSTSIQTLAFDYVPSWLGSLKSMKLAQAALRFTATPDISWPAASFVIGTLTVGSQAAVNINVDGSGLGIISAPQWTLAQMSGNWRLEFDLAAIKTHVPLLLKNGQWIDPAMLLDVEMLLLCNVTLF